MFFKTEIEKSIKILKKGKVLLYPTDTIWGLGCDPFNINAIKNIYKIKKRRTDKNIILLVDEITRINYIIGKKVPFFIKEFILVNKIKKNKPITIIYDINKKNKLPKFFTKGKNTVAIRVTHDLFCSCLIKKLDKPIISTSANISGFSSPICFSEINLLILKNADYVVNIRRKEKSKYRNSKIIQFLSSKKIKILRR